MKQICVLGAGYVGLVTSACFADLGNNITCIDIDENKIETLNRGESPIFEPGLSEMMQRNIRAGRLHFTTSYAEGLKDAEFVFVAVGTPSGADGEAELKYVRMAAEGIAKAMQHPLIIINKALGYEIHSSIMSFMWNAAAGRVSWMVKNRFIEMKPESEQQHGQWLKKRLETHEQSMSHFLQWLIHRKKDDAYELVLCKRFPVTPLKMHEYFFTVPDSIIKIGEFPDEYILHFDNILRVTFKKTNQISYLKTNQEQITLDAFGFPQEVYAFEVYGYWAKMGMANALPLYFNIDKWLK